MKYLVLMLPILLIGCDTQLHVGNIEKISTDGMEKTRTIHWEDGAETIMPEGSSEKMVYTSGDRYKLLHNSAMGSREYHLKPVPEEKPTLPKRNVKLEPTAGWYVLVGIGAFFYMGAVVLLLTWLIARKRARDGKIHTT